MSKKTITVKEFRELVSEAVKEALNTESADLQKQGLAFLQKQKNADLDATRAQLAKKREAGYQAGIDKMEKDKAPTFKLPPVVEEDKLQALAGAMPPASEEEKRQRAMQARKNIPAQTDRDRVEAARRIKQAADAGVAPMIEEEENWPSMKAWQEWADNAEREGFMTPKILDSIVAVLNKQGETEAADLLQQRFGGASLTEAAKRKAAARQAKIKLS